MRNEQQAAIISGCMDNLAIYPCLAIHRERFELALEVVGSLKGYPQPQEGKDAPKELLAAYCYVSTARHTLELALLGFMTYTHAVRLAEANLGAALGFLVAEPKEA